MPYFNVILDEFFVNTFKRSSVQKEMLIGETSALAGVCHFFVPKKGLAIEKSNHFDILTAAQKNSPQEGFGPAAPLIRLAQTLFCFSRLQGVKMEIFLRPFRGKRGSPMRH